MFIGSFRTIRVFQNFNITSVPILEYRDRISVLSSP